MIIRKATSIDLSRVLDINKAFVPRVGPVDLEWFQKYLNLAALFDVVELGGKVEAFVVGMLPETDYGSENFKWFKERYENFIYVDRIAVSETAQGQGIGKKIYDNISEKWAGKVPVIACEVNIRPANPQSLEFHKKVGFKEVGQQETKGGTIRVSMLLKNI